MMADEQEQYREEFLNLGLMIGYYRRRRQLSQEALAEQVGISRAYLSRLEAPNIVSKPALKTVFALARALEIPAYKLLKSPD